MDLSYFSTRLYENITFDFVLKFFVVYFFIIWLAIVLWVFKDISNRTHNLIYQTISILTVSLLTPLGIFVYLMIRPSKTLFEKYYEEIEDNLDLFNQIIEEKNRQYEEDTYCFSCEEPIKPDFKFCPNCKISLKNKCSGCQKLIHSDWNMCPYCGTPNEANEAKNNKKI